MRDRAAAGGARRADVRGERAEADGVRLRRAQPPQRTRAAARVANGVRGARLGLHRDLMT